MLRDLLGDGPLKEFQPFARYFPDSDMILYVCEDVSYRAQRVTEKSFFEVLWHPHEARPIGVKVVNMRGLHGEMQRLVHPHPLDFHQYVEVFRQGLLHGHGEAIMRAARLQSA